MTEIIKQKIVSGCKNSFRTFYIAVMHYGVWLLIFLRKEQMQMKLVLAEKPSVAQSIAKVLGAAKREDGYLEGNGYVVSWCVGHLVELAQPEVYDAKYSKWAYADLPIFPMDWQYEVSAGTKKQFGILKKLMAREDVASLVCATDAGREGELIFRLVYHKAGCRKPFERLWISSMEIRGKAYTEKADAGEILLAACKDTKSADPVPLGSYRGFQMELSFDSFRNEFDVTLKGAVSHRVALGTDARGNITRLDNALAGIPERLERANEQLNNLYNQQEAAEAEVGKPFPQEAELAAKSQRLAELDAALNMEDSAENRDERSESERPSVLADLKSKAEHIPPAKYSETREEVL